METVPEPKKRTVSLNHMIEKSASRTGISKFTDSKTDRHHIRDLQNVPKLRNVLGSLKKKDRF